MKRKRSVQPSRKMHDIYLIFYEGDSEGEYINLLKREYKSSIKIKAIKEGTRLTRSRVSKITDSMKLDSKDDITTFFMYDQDVPSMNKKLEDIPGVKLLSDPCFELWYLLHTTSKIRYMTSDECNRKLKLLGDPWSNYEKGDLSNSQEMYLWNHRKQACLNAHKLKEGKNPSSTIFRLLERLEEEHEKFK